VLLHPKFDMSKKAKGINPELEDAINTLMTQVMNDPMATITDKMKVVDRALKLEALKLKDSDSEWGSGFGLDDDDDK
jgi:hypothetical protein